MSNIIYIKIDKMKDKYVIYGTHRLSYIETDKEY